MCVCLCAFGGHLFCINSDTSRTSCDKCALGGHLMRTRATPQGHSVPCGSVPVCARALKAAASSAHSVRPHGRKKIHSYIFQLARSVDRDSSKLGSMRDAVTVDQPCLILKSHHRRKSLFKGRESIRSLFQGFTVCKYHSNSLFSTV